jgi:hypothetical protein
MPNAGSISLLCKISRGGFTDERVFRVSLTDGDTYVGACPRQYCFTRKGAPLKRDEPERGKQVDGLVLARHVREDDEKSALVSVPDGEVLLVGTEQIQKDPRGHSSDVLVLP